MEENWKKGLIGWVIVLLVGGYVVGPFIKNLRITADYGMDGVLQNWIMRQTAERLDNSSGNFWVFLRAKNGFAGGNIFYPNKNVLAYSDLLIPSAILGFWGSKMSTDLSDIYGVAMIIGQVTTLSISYWFWRRISGSSWGAMMGTMGLAVAQFRMHYQVHLQMWEMGWWLLGVAAIYMWKETKKTWWLGIGIGALAIQIYESLLPIFFTMVIFVIWVVGDKNWGKENWKKILVAGGVWLVLVGPALGVYAGVVKEFGYQRSIREAAHNSLPLNYVWSYFGDWGNLVLWGVVLLRFRKLGKEKKWLVAVAIVGGTMALGPVLKWGEETVKWGRLWIPLPYGIAYYVIPGFGALRTPSRWWWLLGWAMSGLVALSWKDIRGKKLLVAMAAIVIVVWGGKTVGPVRELPQEVDRPEVYKWLLTREEKVIAFVPMGEENTEVIRMFWNMGGGKQTINGWSGFYPPDLGKKLGEINKGEWEELKKRGAELVVVEENAASGEGELVWEAGETRVYKLK